MTEQAHPGVPRPRRWYAPTVLVGLAGGVLAAVGGASDWARASGDSAGIRVDAVAKGSEAAPLVTALSLVALAAWGVVLVSRGRVRRVVAVMGAVASLGALIAVVLAFHDAQHVATKALVGKGSVGGLATTSLTGWYYASGVGALLTVMAFAVAVVQVPAWPAMGSRYDAPGARAEQPVTDQDMWRALDEGHDPTS
jgi:uncharacterized membrane protein (TIGR02234 family)